jgi:Rdx family
VAELRQRGFDASDRPGEKSQFDVIADGTTIFSKQKEHRFPDDGEVLGLLSSR